jgi:hypothetical protein
MFEWNEDRCPSRVHPPADSPAAFDDDEETEASVMLNRSEAKVLLDEYLKHMIGIEAEQQILEVYGSASVRLWDFMDGRVNRLVEAGLLCTDEVKARHDRAREIQGLQRASETGPSQGACEN